MTRLSVAAGRVPDVDDEELRRWCARLGLATVSARPLGAGRSGSHVHEVRLCDGRAVVVKVTVQPERLDAARREVRVLRALALRAPPCAPPLVAGTEATDGVALALDRCTPSPVPGRAGAAGAEPWTEVAVAVARVHRPVGDRDALGLAPPVPRTARSPHGRTLPVVLEHGDCHLDNLVRDRSGRLLLVDWQNVRLGDGLADLMFCWQRAEFAGSRPPRRAMTEAYAAARGLDTAALALLLDETELRLLEEVWPPHLSWGTDAGRAVMTARLAALSQARDERR